MKQFLKLKFWPVIAGLFTAFAVMMVLEFINSFFYPLPVDLDFNNPTAVQAFTASLPWNAFILVLLGFILGAFSAGYVTTYLSKEINYRLSFAVGIILTLLAILNNLMIGHPFWFNVIGLPTFIIFSFLGHRHLRKVKGGQSEKVDFS
jgi:hypothetical protein